MNFTTNARIPGKLGHVVLNITAVQNYDIMPTGVFVELLSDEFMMLRNKYTYCDCRAADALFRDLRKVMELLKEEETADSLTVRIGDVLAYSYLTGQAVPPTNTMKQNMKLAKRKVQRASVRSGGKRIILDPAHNEFQQFRKFMWKSYGYSKRVRPSFTRLGIEEAPELQEVRKWTSQ